MIVMMEPKEKKNMEKWEKGVRYSAYLCRGNLNYYKTHSILCF